MNERNLWDSINHPTGLADMVHVGWVQRLLRSAEWSGFPGPEPDLVIDGQTRVEAHARRVFDKFVELGIEYVAEPTDSEPGAQRIRPVNEVLAFWKATCIDLCVAFCCAALDAGIYPLILTVTADGGQRRHAIVLVPMERQWAMGCDVLIEEGFSREPMLPNREDLRDLLVEFVGDSGGSWLAIDVEQVTEPGAGWGVALSRGAAYIRDWDWDVLVDVGGLRSRTPDRVLPPGGHIEKVLAPAYAELPEDFTPLQLIKARHGVVPYQQRAEMRQLREWAMTVPSDSRTGRNGRNADISVAVVTGAGGSGKTRMAAQLCHDLSLIGWYAGFLPSTTDVTDEELAALTEVTTELLVVVDYAEEARRGLIARVVRKLRARESATRIVLTARGADTWWEEFREEAEQDGTVLSNTLSLSIRGKQQVERDPWFFGRMYRRAVQRFSHDLNGAVPTDVEVPEGLGDTALDVVLRAWLAVCGEQDGAGRGTLTRGGLYDRVLSVEFAQWRKTPILTEISTSHMRRAAATLSLLAPSRDEDVIDDVLSRLPEWNREHLLRSRFAELLVQSLLRDNGAEAVSLRPDPVAEHLILTVFGKNPDLLDRVLPQHYSGVADSEEANLDASIVEHATELEHQAHNVCVALTRAASLDKGKARHLAGRVLRCQPALWRKALDVALNQGGPFASALEGLISSGIELPLGEIDDAIPIGHPALAEAALAVTRHLAASAERSPEQQAHLANNLSIRLSDVGDREGALGAAREAVELYRGLAEVSPQAYTQNLAGSLNNLANCLSEVGDREGALGAAREAVRLRRALAEASPAAYTPDLAMSLTNLAIRLSEVGERNEALEAAREAVELYRGLAEASPQAYTPNLAMSLNNLANRLSAVGERNEALVAAREAVRLRRALAEASPAAYAPDLAASLNNLAASLSAVGERNEALEAAREAVRLRRALAEASPAAYAPDLAASLNNLANILSEVGERNEALEAAREAVRLRRALAEASPAAYAPDLAASLNNLANLLSEVGERNEALEAAREAVRLRRALAEASPAAYTPDLAASLNNLAAFLSEVGERNEALGAAREAVELYQVLAEVSPQAYTPNLAGSLNNLAIRLSAVGERNEALEAAREAVELYQVLAEVSPAAYAPDLAMSLNNLANLLSEVGERNEALEAAREAVELYQVLAEVSPAAYTPDLAMSLNNLAIRLSAVGEQDEALEAAREAVELYQVLAEASPQAYTPNLAMSLNNLAAFLSEAGEQDEALEAAREAVELYRGLADASPQAYTPDLAASLNNLANRFSEVGERNEALVAAREAVALYRGLAEASPAAYAPDLAMSLNNLASFLSAVGKQDEALEAAREAVELYQVLAEVSPQAYTPNLAGSLNNLAIRLSAVGERNEALEAAREAVELYQVLAEVSPAAYAPDLAMSLNNLANLLSEVGERNEALEAAREAVELYQVLAEVSPAAYTPDLAMSLNNLAIRLSAVGEQDEALEAAREAVELYQVLAEASPQAYTPNLAMSLNNLAAFLSEAGEQDEALEAAREAVELYRGLADASPQAYTPDLAASLNNLANRFSEVGERNEALVAAREAVALYRGLAEASPAAYAPDLAMSLNNLASFLSAVGKQDEALEAAREAVALYRGLAEVSPQAYAPDLAMSLNNLASFLSAVGERNEALGAAREAVRLRRALAEASPAAYTPDLAMSLTNLAIRLSEVGERNEALEAAREAVELYRGLAEVSPQAYTPNLAGSLNNLADILAAGGRHEQAQAAFVEGIDRFSPAVRARLLVARATWRDDGGEAGDVVAAAREADSTDDPVLLGPVRRMIAQVITDAGISDTGLPRWATVDAESATSRIEGWLECSDLAQGVAFLEAQWSSPSASERETLAALADLYAELPPVAALAALVERIADEGIQAITTGLRIHHRVQVLARDWREAHLNGRGASFLREHMRADVGALREGGGNDAAMKTDPAEWDRDLSDPAMRSAVVDVLAAELPDAEATRMGLLLELADLSDPGTAYEVYGSDEGAEDSLRHFLESHNWRAMVAVLGVRPGVADSAHGRIAALLAFAAGGETTERLRELYEYANEEMDAIHRRHLQALLDKALGTDQSPKSFSDLLLCVKE